MNAGRVRALVHQKEKGRFEAPHQPWSIIVESTCQCLKACDASSIAHAI
jgi:hypothetical protein